MKIKILIIQVNKSILKNLHNKIIYKFKNIIILVILVNFLIANRIKINKIQIFLNKIQVTNNNL